MYCKTRQKMKKDFEKDFAPYEEALALKEIGFDEPCFGYWYTEQEDCKKVDVQISTVDFLGDEPDYILAPTFSQAFRWFDENTELMGFVVPSIKEGHFDWLIRIDWEEEIECDEAYSSRIEAELECLRKLIEIVKEKK